MEKNRYEVSINIDGVIGRYCDSKDEMKENLMLLKEAGLTCLDGMCACNDLVSSDQWIHDFHEVTEEAGIRVAQTHLPVLGQIEAHNNTPIWKMSEEEKKRAEIGFRSNAIWGCKNVVVHPQTGWPKSLKGSLCACRAINIDYFKMLLEYAYKYDVNICLETMTSFMFAEGNPYDAQGSHYCANPLELKELHDVLKDEKIKYCIDTGHLNCDGYNIADTIRLLGEDITVLHMQDNFGFKDNHSLPPFGNIDWREIAHALAGIHYEGTLNFEIQGERMYQLDKEAKLAYLKYTYEMGRYIGRMINRCEME